MHGFLVKMSLLQKRKTMQQPFLCRFIGRLSEGRIVGRYPVYRDLASHPGLALVTPPSIDMIQTAPLNL